MEANKNKEVSKKNIWVILTDKPSRLYFDVLTKDLLLQERLSVNPTSFPIERKNIYITSDEEIKEGFVFNTFNNTLYKIVPDDSSRKTLSEPTNLPLCAINKEYCFKIILTTDQDLIKDGVQAIDDEFLEWFVKNLSCEFIEVEKFHGIKTSVAEISAVSGNYDYNWKGRGDLRDYKIIIPKEESFIEFTNTDYCTSMIYNPKEEPKQQTLENITEQIQNKCHSFVESVPNVSYQDATNTFLFMQIAKLILRLKKYEQ